MKIITIIVSILIVASMVAPLIFGTLLLIKLIMQIEKIILYQLFLNSSYGSNEFSLTEFSEKFLNEEVKNNYGEKIPKLKFSNAVEKLEKDELIKRSSKHHLTTLNSWRLSKFCEEKFKVISNKNIFNFEEFESNFYA